MRCKYRINAIQFLIYLAFCYYFYLSRRTLIVSTLRISLIVLLVMLVVSACAASPVATEEPAVTAAPATELPVEGPASTTVPATDLATEAPAATEPPRSYRSTRCNGSARRNRSPGRLYPGWN